MKSVEITSAIIIKTDRAKEHDLRVTLFTPSGLRHANATGALKPTAKLKGALQLFNVVEVGLIGSRITTAHVVQSGSNIPRDIDKYYLAGSICQTIAKLLRDVPSDECAEIFDLTVTAFCFLNSDTPCREIFIAYYSKLLQFLGYGAPELSIPAIKRAFLEHLDYSIDLPKIDH